MNSDPRIAAEQEYVDGLFARIDTEVQQSKARLDKVLKEIDLANPDALVERETAYHALNAKLDQLTIAQIGLVFGRIDIATPPEANENPVPGRPDLERRYIGRMGIDAKEDNYRNLLLDWRAPQARPFYLATTVTPEGVETRRHIRTKGRTVTSIDDEDLRNGKDSAPDIASESALIKALNAARGEHMNTIVETIQREQDAIIRDTTRGVMVVQGGPGTGKTAVALHRAAYLLYTWREQLAKTGVLIVGPNKVFLEYISHVLPELGETGVVLSTVGDLYPGMTPDLADSRIAQEIKGSEEMVYILTQAVRAYQIVPEAPIPIRFGSLELQVTPAMVKSARTRARRSRRPHNDARAIFTDYLLDLLAAQLADLIGTDPLGGANLLSKGDVAQLHDDLAEEPAVLAVCEELWPNLDPIDVLGDLLTSRERIAEAAAEYDSETQDALYRAQAGFSPADAALLDELAQLIGLPDHEATADHEWSERVAEAQEALDILTGSAVQDLDDGFDAEVLMAHDVIDAETLAERQEVRDHRSTAERARADLQWAYGHVIIDEAQELTPMEWRMVMRRCPSHWMTIVGDTAQTGSPAGVDSWTETLAPFVGTRIRLHELTVNYRTPAEIMTYANELLKQIAPEQQPARAIRSTGVPVRFGTIDELADIEGATIIGPGHRPVSDIKGLEFDHVVIVHPDEIATDSLQDLYVAATRATQTLTVLK
ncbi:HelD family protein [Corynebacterium epidermidicanis]|uniref:DNA/RNA helicase, superfamily I n=1 Tax=Corynebacterium epidermidicanis TaxID=1050174 RepID=A0A0G3GTY3_9CORY|nr:ATP-binding domain-containing protein [Corynebacterium epidermidicanis]AKK03013.1 DNA/RNA helicase, superfamily I [Corynebacterium epidermidicanis]